jgi:putative flippase GtrA
MFQYIADGLLLFLFMSIGVDIVYANLISRALVGFSGFIANRYITFSGTRVRFWDSFFRFLLAWILTSSLSTIGVLIAVDLFFQGPPTPTSGLIIKALVEGTVFLLAFVIQKFFIFGSPTIDRKRL